MGGGSDMKGGVILFFGMFSAFLYTQVWGTDSTLVARQGALSMSRKLRLDPLSQHKRSVSYLPMDWSPISTCRGKGVALTKESASKRCGVDEGEESKHPRGGF